ncbi:RNA polymerase sigma-70 factor [Agriterribacter sp.]|uniref:RNA polymerase sigma-70 factor n=1 Tax=Agriterribacter sp. TaxID=2821509 RepID=UPI002C009FB0|nr:RNA polymerase sigma-70 factor [Agriterribacter sp.]HTN05455.1 RNA polymerase sigma-70 factor [Agriterribacter sp.]
MRNGEEVKSLFFDVCSNGNMESYDLLYKLMCTKLIHFSAAIIGSFHMAEEVVSDVFIMLWQKRERLSNVRNPLMYIYVCTRNLSLNALSQRKKHVDYETLDRDALAMAPDIEHRIISTEVAQIIEKAIRELPTRCQLIFRLVKIDGLSYKEVAELLEISTKTVDAQLAVAIKKLSSAIRLSMPNDLLSAYFQLR